MGLGEIQRNTDSLALRKRVGRRHARLQGEPGDLDVDKSLRSKVLHQDDFPVQIRRTRVLVRPERQILRTNAEDHLSPGGVFQCTSHRRRKGNHACTRANHGAVSILRQGSRHHVHRRSAYERGDEDVGRTMKDLQRWSVLLDLPVTHDDDHVAHRHRFHLVVSHVHHRGLEPPVELDELLAHGDAQVGVQVAERLVEQEHLGIAHVEVVFVPVLVPQVVQGLKPAGLGELAYLGAGAGHEVDLVRPRRQPDPDLLLELREVRKLRRHGDAGHDPHHGRLHYASTSCLVEVASALMRSEKVNLFFDQSFVKEPNTPDRTPWHNDLPFWPIRGRQVITTWVALDMENVAGRDGQRELEAELEDRMQRLMARRGDTFAPCTDWKGWFDAQRRVVRNAYGELSPPETCPDWSLLY